MLCDAYAALHEFLEPYTSSPSSAEYSTYVRYSRNSKGKSLTLNERTPDQCSVDQKPTASFNGPLMRSAFMPSIMARQFLRAYRIYAIRCSLSVLKWTLPLVASSLPQDYLRMRRLRSRQKRLRVPRTR